MAANELDVSQLLTFSDFLRESTGISFNESNWIGLKISLHERMAANNIGHPEAYLTQLKKDAIEREELIALVVVPETYFYRNRRQFDTLQRHVLPKIIAKRRSIQTTRPKIKIVSCGCSIGAEPYSLAIALHEGKLLESANFEINAFDISSKAIERAKQAIYSKYYFREPNAELTMYFEKQGNNFVLQDRVKELVTFYQCNLFDIEAKDFILKEADVVFFRNVLIYFNEEGILRAIETIAENITREGYLFLGHAETLLWRNTSFDLEKINDTTTWRLKDVVASTSPAGGQKRTLTKPLDRSESKSKEFKIKKPVLPEDKPLHLKPRLPSAKKKEKEESHYESGAGYHAIKQLDKAESEYLAQLIVESNHPESLIGLARIYADRGKDQLAMDTCQNVLKSNNLLPDGHFIMGNIEYKNHNYDSAIDHFKRAIYCDDKHFTAQCYLGFCLKALGKTDEANKQFHIAAHTIDDLGSEGLTKEVGGHSASYILSLCIDSIS